MLSLFFILCKHASKLECQSVRETCTITFFNFQMEEFIFPNNFTYYFHIEFIFPHYFTYFYFRIFWDVGKDKGVFRYKHCWYISPLQDYQLKFFLFSFSTQSHKTQN